MSGLVKRNSFYFVSVMAVLCGPVVAQDQRWLRLNDRGNRYEGTVDRPNAARDYELLGFFAYRQNFLLRDNVSLLLRFYLPSNEAAFIEAREIRVERQYLMRPKPERVSKHPGGWSEFTGWPVSDVLKPNAIPADNLGVIVRLNNNNEYTEDLAPAILLSSDQSTPSTIESYVIYLTVNKKLKNLDYQITGRSAYSQAYQYKGDQKDRSVEGGTVIPLRFAAKKLPEGPVVVRVHAPYVNNLVDRLFVEYHFYHKPL